MKPKYRAYIKELGIMLDDVTPYTDGDVGIDSGILDKKLESISGNGTKYYIDWDECIRKENEEEDIYDNVINLLLGEDWVWIGDGDAILMQFVTDHNGFDIYDGDIVLVKGMKRIVEYRTYIKQEKFGYVLNTNRTYLQNDAAIFNIKEVLGNIHQNPDILK